MPPSVKITLNQTATLLQNHNYRKAADLLEQCNRHLTSKLPEKGEKQRYANGITMLLFYKGTCEMMQHHFTLARPLFAKVVKALPTLKEAWQNLGKIDYELQHYNDAAHSFAEAYHFSNNTEADFLYYSALSYFAAGNTAQATLSFQQLFQHHPEKISISWKEYFIQALIANHTPVKAIPLLKELVKEVQGDTLRKWQATLLALYNQLGMNKEALNLARILCRTDSSYTQWWKMRTQTALNGHLEEEALASLTIASYQSPLQENEKKLLADLNLQQNIPQQAEIYYREILNTASPHKLDNSILFNLLVACRKRGHFQEALDLLTQYAPETKDHDLLLTKADILYTLQHFHEAEKAYEKVAKIKNEQSAHAWLMAGYAAWQDNDITTSRMAFNKAAEDKTQRRAALQAIQRLE